MRLVSGLVAVLLCCGVISSEKSIYPKQRADCSCTAEHGSLHDHHAMLLDGSRNVSLAEYRVPRHERTQGEDGRPAGLRFRHLGFSDQPIRSAGARDKRRDSQRAEGDCNGENEQSLFTYLKSCCPPASDMIVDDKSSLYWKPLRAGDVRWNFEKFLVDPEGKAVVRFTPPVEPAEMEPVIEEFLRKWNVKVQREISAMEDLLSDLMIEQ
uniref:Glutathione peroxidase n=1 Tax=Branchiostoma floridae TaxID=7739 RepID=C3Z4T0_BRAFL|eukprot:XP_002596440.1 hypothetical protein BRAFLDRAFT_121592 [Branchiostoma floridae]